MIHHYSHYFTTQESVHIKVIVAADPSSLTISHPRGAKLLSFPSSALMTATIETKRKVWVEEGLEKNRVIEVYLFDDEHREEWQVDHQIVVAFEGGSVVTLGEVYQKAHQLLGFAYGGKSRDAREFNAKDLINRSLPPNALARVKKGLARIFGGMIHQYDTIPREVAEEHAALEIEEGGERVGMALVPFKNDRLKWTSLRNILAHVEPVREEHLPVWAQDGVWNEVLHLLAIFEQYK